MLCLIGTAFVSCVGTAPTKEVHLIDSLNQAAYAYRYKNLDSSCHAASKAYRGVKLYRQGKAEASVGVLYCVCHILLLFAATAGSFGIYQ